MIDSPSPARRPISLHGLGADVAVLTAIDQALDVPHGELPARVALVRGYLRYALDSLPDARRTATFRVIAGMIARDTGQEKP